MTNVFAEHVVAYAQAGWPCVLPVPTRDKFPPPVPGLTEPVALYRHLDARGELLYVGISSDPARRWLQHVETSLWARFSALTFWQWYSDRTHAREAEKAAIRREAPIFNTARPGNGPTINDLKVRYLRTETSGLPRRVPCRAVTGEFCIACGPDAELLYAATITTLEGTPL